MPKKQTSAARLARRITGRHRPQLHHLPHPVRRRRGELDGARRPAARSWSGRGRRRPAQGRGCACRGPRLGRGCGCDRERLLRHRPRRSSMCARRAWGRRRGAEAGRIRDEHLRDGSGGVPLRLPRPGEGREHPGRQNPRPRRRRRPGRRSAGMLGRRPRPGAVLRSPTRRPPASPAPKRRTPSPPAKRPEPWPPPPPFNGMATRSGTRQPGTWWRRSGTDAQPPGCHRCTNAADTKPCSTPTWTPPSPQNETSLSPRTAEGQHAPCTGRQVAAAPDPPPAQVLKTMLKELPAHRNVAGSGTLSYAPGRSPASGRPDRHDHGDRSRTRARTAQHPEAPGAAAPQRSEFQLAFRRVPRRSLRARLASTRPARGQHTTAHPPNPGRVLRAAAVASGRRLPSTAWLRSSLVLQL